MATIGEGVTLRLLREVALMHISIFVGRRFPAKCRVTVSHSAIATRGLEDTKQRSSSRSGINCRPKGWTDGGPSQLPIRVMTALTPGFRHAEIGEQRPPRHAASKQRATCRVTCTEGAARFHIHRDGARLRRPNSVTDWQKKVSLASFLHRKPKQFAPLWLTVKAVVK